MGTIKTTFKKADEHFMRSRADIPYLYVSPDSPLKCSRCGANLGLWRMVRTALFKKKGTIYFVTCKRCKTMNKREKGKLKEDLEERWTNNK